MVRFRVGLGLGLGFNVDIQNGTIMSINEEPSPNLIGRQVDKSTIQFWQYRQMTYLDVQPHFHWKLKGLLHVDIASESNLGGFFL